MGRIPISRLHLSRLQLSFLFIRQLVVYAIDFSFFFILNPFNPIFNPPSSSIVQEPPGVMMMCWCFSLFAIGLCLRDILLLYSAFDSFIIRVVLLFIFLLCRISRQIPIVNVQYTRTYAERNLYKELLGISNGFLSTTQWGENNGVSLQHEIINNDPILL